MKKEVKHTTVRNNNLFCLNCGGSYPLKMPVEVKEMAKKIDSFNNLHWDCEPTWKEPEADQSESVQKKALWWITNGHIGNSSKTMWQCFMNVPIERINHPYDPDDFSRCYKLLQAVPEWKQKSNMQKLEKLSNPWKNLVKNWDKLTEMFEQNVKEGWKNSDKIGMYEFMQTLIR